MKKKTNESILLFGKALFGSDKSQLLALLQKKLSGSKKTTLLFTPNPEQIVLANESEDFSRVLSEGDILIPDGIGLVWASKILANQNKGVSLDERIAGREVVSDLLNLAQQEGYKVLVIGGREYSRGDQFELRVGSKVSDQDKKQTKKLSLWWLEGFKDIKSRTKGEEAELLSQIEKIGPDIIFVAFGAPYQEKWLVENLKELEKLEVKLGMAVGGSFDYLLGRVSQVPAWMGAIGLEWWWRLVTQPWRVWRQLRLVRFMALVVKEKFSK